MILVNIFEAKAKLSEYVEAASRGERVVICNRNRPVAELRAIAAAPARRLGLAAGAVTLPSSFFEPLPDDLLDAFDGREIKRTGASKVSEARAPYSKKRGRRA
jgi:prevent-host-death family protein